MFSPGPGLQTSRLRICVSKMTAYALCAPNWKICTSGHKTSSSVHLTTLTPSTISTMLSLIQRLVMVCVAMLLSSTCAYNKSPSASPRLAPSHGDVLQNLAAEDAQRAFDCEEQYCLQYPAVCALAGKPYFALCICCMSDDCPSIEASSPSFCGFS